MCLQDCERKFSTDFPSDLDDVELLLLDVNVTYDIEIEVSANSSSVSVTENIHISHFGRLDPSTHKLLS